MNTLTCKGARKRLAAFHDGELGVSDQIMVGAHVGRCDSCAAELLELQRLREVLRRAAPGRPMLYDGFEDLFDADNSLSTSVMMRLEAHPAVSLRTVVHDLFGERQVVFAGLTAAAAMLACVLSLCGIVRFGATVRPDSLSALINSVPPPGSNENPVQVNGYVLMPRALDRSISSLPAIAGDSEVMFVAVVTREGTVTNVELHHATNSRAAESVMGAMSEARFDPARVDGLPVAVNMVWLVTNTTVRASEGKVVHVKRRFV